MDRGSGDDSPHLARFQFFILPPPEKGQKQRLKQNFSI